MRILIAEDDAASSSFLSTGLAAEHYEVRVAPAGRRVSQWIDDGECDLLILDVDPTGAGEPDVLHQVRNLKPHLPVLILAASARVEDCVDSLDSGADDYLAKPFVFAELSARVRALLRRSSVPCEPVLRNMDLELNRVRRIVNRGGNAIELTPKEFALLEYLMLNAGRSVSRSSILRDVWKLSSDTLTNVVDVYINYLRRKIDANAAERLIHTVRGAGYRIGTMPDATR